MIGQKVKTTLSAGWRGASFRMYLLFTSEFWTFWMGVLLALAELMDWARGLGSTSEASWFLFQCDFWIEGVSRDFGGQLVLMIRGIKMHFKAR